MFLPVGNREEREKLRNEVKLRANNGGFQRLRLRLEATKKGERGELT